MTTKHFVLGENEKHLIVFRFQGNESVRKTINNNIRYATDREEKAVYGQQLEDQIRQRRETEEKEKVQSREIARQLVRSLCFMFSHLFACQVIE